MYKILEEDLVILDIKIESLKRANLALADDFREAVNQSSETWHDNAPFDAVRDQQSIIMAELDQLNTIRRSVMKVTPRKSTKVAVGSRVELHIGSKVMKLMIGGAWVGRDKVDDYKLVACNSPIALAVIGKRVGEKADMPTGLGVILTIL